VGQICDPGDVVRGFVKGTWLEVRFTHRDGTSQLFSVPCVIGIMYLNSTCWSHSNDPAVTVTSLRTGSVTASRAREPYLVQPAWTASQAHPSARSPQLQNATAPIEDPQPPPGV
jgi:hypothetical protein